MKINFTDLFDIKKETDNSKTPNLTEERIYSLCQDINRGMEKVPVFSGSTLNEGIVGYVPNYIKEKNSKIKQTAKSINYYSNKKDCITIVADGKVGFMFYREAKRFPLFCMNIHCLAIFNKKIEEIKKIKEEYSKFDGLNLKWFYFKFSNMFKNLIRWEGVPSFSKTIYSQIELEIPNLKEQEQELSNYEEMYNLSVKLEKVIDKIDKIKEKHIEGELIGDEIPAKDIFESVSGNSGLTEEYIYSNIDIKDNSKRYKVLSSSTIDRTSLGEVKKGVMFNGKEMKTFEGEEGLLVIRNGDAGRIIFLEKGFYTLNDHAYILYLNEDYKSKVNLKWVMYQYQKLFLEFSSNSDNGTWNKTNFMKQAKITLISPEKQEEIIKSYEDLENLEKGVLLIKNKITKLFGKELVSITN